MPDFLDFDLLATPVAFGLTYLLHSTVWILLISLLVKLPWFQAPRLQNYFWKAALLGGVFTSSMAFFSGTYLVQIPSFPEAESVLAEDAAFLSTSMEAEEIAAWHTLNESLESYSPEAWHDHENHSEHATLAIEDEAAIQESWHETLITEVENEAESTLLSYVLALLPELPKLPSLKVIIPWLFGVVGISWLAGIVFLMLQVFIQHILFFRRIKERKLINHPTVFTIFQAIQTKAKTMVSFQLTSTSFLDSPMVIRGREICIPEKAIQTLEEKQLEGMIAHELAHIVRKDYYWTWFIILIDTVFFFQPLHKLVKKKIHTTNELLCDAWAAQTTGNSLALAQCLVTIAEWMSPKQPNYQLVAGMALKPSELSNRITQLINSPDMKKQRFHFFRANLPLVVILAFVLLGLPGFSFTTIPFLEQIGIAMEEAEEPLTIDFPESEEMEELTDYELENTSTEVTALEEEMADYLQKDQPETSPTTETFYLEGEELEAVMEAICAGNYDLVKTMIDNGLNVESQTEEGYTLLMQAAHSREIEIIQLLLDRGAKVNRISPKGYSALMEAAEHNYIDVAKLLLKEGADVNFGTDDGYTPLMEAVYSEAYEIVQLFIDKGAKINHFCRSGDTPLIMASDEGLYSIAQLLIKEGADVNFGAANGHTPLIQATHSGHYDVTKLLISKGAKIEHSSDEGHSPMTEAAEHGHLAIAELLIREGADVNYMPAKGRNALIMAAHSEELAVAKLLIENGADVNQAADDGYTALIEAAEHGEYELVKLLLKKGADINAETKDGWTALRMAASNGHNRIAELLMEKRG